LTRSGPHIYPPTDLLRSCGGSSSVLRGVRQPAWMAAETAFAAWTIHVPCQGQDQRWQGAESVL